MGSVNSRRSSQDHDDYSLTRKELVNRLREDKIFGLRVVHDSYCCCCGTTVLAHLDSVPLPLPAVVSGELLDSSRHSPRAEASDLRTAHA